MNAESQIREQENSPRFNLAELQSSSQQSTKDGDDGEFNPSACNTASSCYPNDENESGG